MSDSKVDQTAVLAKNVMMNASLAPWWREIPRYQWTVLLVAWFVFMFDLMDSTLYTLVMVPAIRELLGGTVSTQVIG